MISRARRYRPVVVRTRLAGPAHGAEPVGGPSEPGGLPAKLARGSATALLVYTAGAGLTYCAQLALTRTIGTSGYGVYAYVFAWVTVLAYASALGFDVSLLRFVPAYLAPRAFDLLQGVVVYSRRRVAVVGCGIAFTGAVCTLILSGDLPPDLAGTFLVGFMVVPILALLWISVAVVRGFGSVASALAPDRMVRDGVLLVLVLLATQVVGWRIDAPLAMVATLLGSTAGLGLVSLGMRRLCPCDLNGVTPAYDVPTWRRTALPLVVIGVAEALMNRTGVLLLG
ncbi:MAG: lipopolysaccharide biosynthesis protein, partial [Stellaceae bacterium]